LLHRIVKSTLALKGMTIRDLAKEIKENYSSVYDVIHGRWGKNKGEVATRILKKISEFLDLDIDLVNGAEFNIEAFDDIFRRMASEKKKRRKEG
jgi:predicted transcriptional regulator